ncbi:Crp/Fnr family transcriptional regulator [Mangrovibacterium lignilyticum]|uniref:Crp/Fnr family transcriptional regulator n=1 Tax=Mangrovibacterium lignilyticum TaxID=2668052 RepID=UPI0013D7A037|nr:Crp/Fnr family transcriptional regulator [Mangrovibacterium lignilyticum]
MKSILPSLEKRFPFFEKELIAEMHQNSIVQEFNPGDEILREGQYIKSFPIVLEGNIRIVRNDSEGRELLLYFLNPGEACSMALTCCVGEQQSNINAYAEQQSTIIRIPSDLLDHWMIKYPSWKTYIMYSYRKRFDELLETIDAIAFLGLDEQLSRYFYARFKATGETVFQGTHQEIANHLNTSREVVSRLLKQMEQKKLISLSRGAIDYSQIISLTA